MTIDPGRRCENRRFSRRDTNYSGWILAHGRPRQLCVVENLSLGGALIRCENPGLLPFKFELVIETTNTRYLCEFRRCTADAVGVEFCDVEKHSEASAHHPSSEGDWDDHRAHRTVRTLGDAIDALKPFR